MSDPRDFFEPARKYLPEDVACDLGLASTTYTWWMRLRRLIGADREEIARLKATVETLGNQICEFHDTNPLNETVMKLEMERDEWKALAQIHAEDRNEALRKGNELNDTVEALEAENRVARELVEDGLDRLWIRDKEYYQRILDRCKGAGMSDYLENETITLIEEFLKVETELEAERDAALRDVRRLTLEVVGLKTGLEIVRRERDAALRDEQLAIAERDEVAHERDQLQGIVASLQQERDATLRERDGLLRQIDEMRRLKEDEDPIAVSQQFDGNGPWVVHGRNANRQPKIAYELRQEEAEIAANAVRRVIAEAMVPLKVEIERLKKARDEWKILAWQHDSDRNAALRERELYKEALQKAIASLNEKIGEPKEKGNAGQ